MNFFFSDDARQERPSRHGMGPLVAIGGVRICSRRVRELERALDSLCADVRFPARQEFKWSPGRELWMHANLVEERRRDFFIRALVSCPSGL